jgi:lysozyme
VERLNWIALTAAVGIAYFLIRPDARGDTNVEENDTNLGPREADENVSRTPSIGELNLVDPVNQDAVGAFLYMIRASEHVYPRDVLNDAAYNIFYGGSRFNDLSDHPTLTGEKRGIPLPDAICKSAGLKPGCVSTAAGAYQIIRPTWVRLKQTYGLPDFSKESQDAAAIYLLMESGALELIQQGRIEEAIRKASKIWASLPGNTYQQNPKSLAYALDRFNEGLA